MSVAKPNATITIRDNGLGIVSQGNDGIGVLIGTSSAGTVATFYPYAGSDTSNVQDDLGKGPLVDQTIKNLLHSSGKETIAYKSAATTAGSSSAVTRSNGTTGPVVSISVGTPYDYGQSSIVIVAGGVLGTSTFKYSSDGGDTYTAPIATAATYDLGNGVTVAFAAGTYVVGETYSWTDTPPILSTTNVSDAMDAVIDSIYDPEFVHVLGQASSAANSATMATTLATKVDAAWTAHKYFFAILEAAADTPANVATAFASFSNKSVMACAGFAEVVNDRTGQIEKRSSARVIVPRIARNPIAIHLARDAADSDLDPLPDVDELVPSGAASSTGYYDEDKTPSLNAAHFSTLRTISGRAGFYVTNGLTMAADTSDFQQIQYLRIILKAARAWYKYALTQLARRVAIDTSTGFIKTSFAKGIEDAGKAVILTSLGNQIAGARVLVNRADDLNADPTLRATIRVAVDSYIMTFESDIGLTSNLTAAA
jgi:hypothetical protein